MLLDTRTQGPVKGNGDPTLSMYYVANEDRVNVGDKIVTSGMDKIFPRDIPVGTVVDVKPGTTFKQIRVKPTANLERLEEVIVLLTQEPVEFPSVSEAQGAAQSNGNAAPEADTTAPASGATAEKP